MIVCMKNYVRISAVLSLSLALNQAQACFADPVAQTDSTAQTATADTAVQTAATDPAAQTDPADPAAQTDSAGPAAQTAPAETIPDQAASGEDTMQIPLGLSPIGTDQAIREQVQAAAQWAQAQIQSESGSKITDPKLLEEKRRRQEKQLEQLRELLNAQLHALNTAEDEHDTSGYHIDPQLMGSENLYPELFPAEETETETETEFIEETETETELIEETETEFHPVEMGALIPDAGNVTGDTKAPDNTSAETEAASPDPGEEGKDGEPETENSSPGLVSRHGVFAVPTISGLNEARINLYDYRMLREYPLPRLPKDLHQLQTQLEAQLAEYEGTWSVFVQNLTTGQTMIINDASMRSASVMKLFIMETVYEAFDRGDLERNEDNVYLLRNMIINSSNDSANRLLEILGNGDMNAGVARVNEFIQLHGYSSGTYEFNGFQDNSAIVDPNHANVVTAKDVGLLLNRVYSRSFISRQVCNEIEQMMLDQTTRFKIPRGLPDGVLCGNKSGETDSIANDSAVIYGPTTDYILVVLSNGWSSENAANEQVEEVSRTVYQFFEG